MKPIKIRVRNQKHSEIVQRMLFAAGCHWKKGSQCVQYCNEPFLFVYKQGTIMYGGHDEAGYFNRHPYTEVNFDWCIPERETIDIDGFGKFYKDEVEECLDRLERVE